MAGASERDAVVVWPEGDLRRRVVLDGVEVTLARRGGVWAVVGEERLASEARLLDALGQPNEALERSRGVVAALNADLVRPDQLSGLVRRLSWMWGRAPYRYQLLAADARDALAVACAHLPATEEVFEFVCWVLAKRLEWPLRRTPWVPPGSGSWRWPAGWEFDTALDARLGPAFFEAMTAHPEPRFGQLVAASDPCADPKQLAAIARDADDHLLDLLAANPATPVHSLQALSCGTAHDYSEVCERLRVLQNPSAPGWLIAEAAVAEVHAPFSGRWRASTAEEIQRIWALCHPRCPLRLMRDLASHSSAAVRAAVARSPRAPARVLEALAPSLDTEVRAGVAENPSTPRPLLRRAGADPHRSVRAAAAQNPSTAPRLVERLAADPVAAVRLAAAMNPAGPPAVLRVLCDDADVGVAVAAAANPTTDRTAMDRVAARLAGHSSPQARAAAAALADTPAELLSRLAADEHPDVRHAAASNPRTPGAALAQIAQQARRDGDLDMLHELIDNRSVRAGLRSLVAEACVELAGPPPQHQMTAAARRGWATR